MADIIVGVILIVVVGSASYYIWKEKKKGRRCIGCPSSGSCPKCGRSNNPPII